MWWVVGERDHNCEITAGRADKAKHIYRSIDTNYIPFQIFKQTFCTCENSKGWGSTVWKRYKFKITFITELLSVIGEKESIR